MQYDINGRLEAAERLRSGLDNCKSKTREADTLTVFYGLQDLANLVDRAEKLRKQEKEEYKAFNDYLERELREKEDIILELKNSIVELAGIATARGARLRDADRENGGG
jgi:hypothetical protein